MKSKLFTVYNKLSKKYGWQNWWPIIHNNNCLYLPEFIERPRNSNEVLEIMIGAILTQNTAWTNVVKALINLKTHLNNNLDFNNLLLMNNDLLASIIRPAGYFNQKTKKIKALLNFILEKVNGDWMNLIEFPLDEARKLLLSIWGVGKETADSILLYGYNFQIFMIDAYTKRIFSRLGFFHHEIEYDEVRKLFEKNLPKDTIVYKEYHALIVELGKNICKNKPLCSLCILKKRCNYGKTI